MPELITPSGIPLNVRLMGLSSAQSSPSDPAGTNNTTGLMMGLAGSITPQSTGTIVIWLSGDVGNDTATDGAKTQLRYGTGTAPTNGAALTGTTAGGLVVATSSANAERLPLALQARVSGLTLGTAYWVDCGLGAVTGGTVTLKNVSLTMVEI